MLVIEEVGPSLYGDKAHNNQYGMPKSATIPGGRLIEAAAALALPLLEAD